MKSRPASAAGKSMVAVTTSKQLTEPSMRVAQPTGQSRVPRLEWTARALWQTLQWRETASGAMPAKLLGCARVHVHSNSLTERHATVLSTAAFLRLLLACGMQRLMLPA